MKKKRLKDFTRALSAILLLVTWLVLLAGCGGLFTFGDIDSVDAVVVLWSGIDNSFFMIDNQAAAQEMAQLIPSTKNSVKGTKVDKERISGANVIRINYLIDNYYAASLLVDKDLYAYYVTLNGNVRVFEQKFALEKFVFAMLSYSTCEQVSTEGADLNQLLSQLQEKRWSLSTINNSDGQLVGAVTFNCQRMGRMSVYEIDDYGRLKLQINLGGQYNYTFISQ